MATPMSATTRGLRRVPALGIFAAGDKRQCEASGKQSRCVHAMHSVLKERAQPTSSAT